MGVLPVVDWGSGSSLTATITAAFEKGVFRPGRHELVHHTPLRKLVKPGSKGTVDFSVMFLAEQPSGSVFRRWQPKAPIVLTIQFECDDSGDLSASTRPEVSGPWAYDFTLGVTFHTWTNNRLGGPEQGYKAAPPEIRVLHILADFDLYVLKGWGERQFTHYDKGNSTFGVPFAKSLGSDDKESAFLGRMMVELVQPVSKLQGVSYQVQFPVDDSKITPAEAIQFDKFLNESIKNIHEVRTALERGLLTFRGEARASATYHGPPVPGRKHHNQELSEKRKKAAVEWMRKSGVKFAEPTLIQAVGDTKALKVGEENPFERRCNIDINGEELTWAVQQDWLSNGFVK